MIEPTMAKLENEIAAVALTHPALTKEQAKRLADLHLALAQLYRDIAGLKPISTAAHQRKIASG